VRHYDARGVHTTFSYDGLNRVTQISYSDSTPTAHYYYDSQSLPSGAPSTSSPDSYSRGYSAGRLVAMTYGSGATGNYFGYDNIGRVTIQFQLTGSTPAKYKLTYGYNYLNEVTSETYPSGCALSYAYDDGGRLSSLSDGTTTFANNLTYAPHGGLTSETWGNTSVHSMNYNRRLQASQAKLSLGSSVLQQYDYGYGEFNTSTGATDTSKNNGQIGNVTATIGSTTQWLQGFQYDELGRLKNAAEYQSGTMSSQTWTQGYTFDRYGNRFQSANTTLGLPAVTSSDINAATNRFINTGSTPTTYDAAGNITTDTKFRNLNYAYDANGRMTFAEHTDHTNQQNSVYDCAGQRVQTSANGVTRTLVYDIFGQDVADYSSGALERENIYRGGQLLATQEFHSRANFALASNGGTATAQNYTQDGVIPGLHFQPSYAIDGLRHTTSDGGNFWRDEHGLPSWLEVDFNGNKTIDEIDVITSQSYPDYTTGNDPTATQTFNQYGAQAFDVQYWNGSAWATVPGGSITGNSLVWKKLTFSNITTSKIRVVVNGSSDGVARIVELEAWGTAAIGAGPINYVLSDIQGSTRAVMSNNGSSSAIIARHDYLPFGEELFSGIGLRSTSQGFGATDTNRQKYGLTERDDATGLDHTWWRKYENFSGRWTSPDPYTGSLSLGDPQTLNRYTYTVNDSVNFVDPSGLASCGVNPITGTPGFTNEPRGVPGHLRPGVGGQGYFGASRGHGTRSHAGLDISGISGASAVYANLTGIVRFVGWGGDAGNLVIIDHGDGLSTRYGHLSRFEPGIKKGSFVFEGDRVGVVGQTGNAAGQLASEAHVHFGVQLNGRTINPATYLNSHCPGPQDSLDSPLHPGGGGDHAGQVGGGDPWQLYAMWQFADWVDSIQVGHVTVTVKLL